MWDIVLLFSLVLRNWQKFPRIQILMKMKRPRQRSRYELFLRES